jgi:chromosome partitioning protein
MKIITISTNKGGVGKTTTVVNLACSLARQGYKIGMIDFDAQANLSNNYWGQYKANNDLTKIIRTQQFIQKQDFTLVGDNLWILPNFENLTEGLFYSLYPSATQTKDRYMILSILLQELEGFDYLLIDTPPNLENRSISAIMVADFLLCPVLLEKSSIDAVKNIIKIVQGLASNYSEFKAPVSALVHTRVSRITKLLNSVMGKYSNQLLPILCQVYSDSKYNYATTKPAYYSCNQCKLDHDNLAKKILELLK